MATIATPPRRSNLRRLLEVHGFSMDTLPDARHVLLIPDHPRLAGIVYRRDEHDVTRRQIIDAHTHVAWSGYTKIEAPQDQTRAALWDLMALVDASPQIVLEFVTRWGLYVDSENPDRPGSVWVSQIKQRARLLRSFLMTLVATEAGEVLDESQLLDLAEIDFGVRGLLGPEGPLDRNPSDEREARRRVGLPEEPDAGGEIEEEAHLAWQLMPEIRLERWRAERSSGHGVELQERLIVNVLAAKARDNPEAFVWDAAGRRIERSAVGLAAIVWSHLLDFFARSTLDVYLCGVCRKPFEFDPDVAQRRPRSGAGRFCSKECRLEAKRASNRDSWRRNGSKWRPKKDSVVAPEGRRNEPQG